LGDVQYGSEGCDIPKLKDYIAEALDEGAFFLGMGDFHDVLSPSNRQRLKSAALYDNASNWLERKMEEDILFLYEDVLKPTQGRWLGMLEGHHFWEFTDGTTTDTRLCSMLDAPFLGTCGFMRMTFVKEKGNGERALSTSCDIWAHHGSRGGGSVGTILRQLDAISGSFTADLYFMGHANRLEASPKALLELGGSNGNIYLKNRDRYLVATGAFDKGYMVGSKDGMTGRPRGGYVEQGAMRPTSMGSAMVKITPVIKNVSALGQRRINHTELEIRVTI
jgi:hypothetical protein